MTNAPNKTSYYKLLLVGLALIVLIVAGITGIYLSKAHKHDAESVERAKELKEGPVVKTAIATYSSNGKELVLIGEARPYQTTTLYAKISGYLEKINVDKGDKVTQDQLLASIDNPEIDQQYNSALADLENKKKIADRDKQLLAKKYVAQEEADVSQTAVDIAEANVKSLAEQQQYKYLKAPFSGTITSRYVDQGALIQNANNSETSSQPVVTLAQLDKLRIYVYAEQRDASFLKIGDSVDITLTERPDVHVKATLSRIAGELDPKTRMMLCEIDVENKNDVIIPGSYVQVYVKYSTEQNPKKELTLPSVALVMHKDKTMIAVIDKDSVLHFKEVTVSRNTGEKISIANGINEGDRAALSVGESIIEGQKVRIVE